MLRTRTACGMIVLAVLLAASTAVAFGLCSHEQSTGHAAGMLSGDAEGGLLPPLPIYREGRISGGSVEPCGCWFLTTYGSEKYELWPHPDSLGFTCGDAVGVLGFLCDDCISVCMGAPILTLALIVALEDTDDDGMADDYDNCPLDSNPAQTDTDGDGMGDACDVDDDNDDFEDSVESHVGTDPLDDCPDGPTDGAWPPDMDNDTHADIGDVLQFKPLILAGFPCDGDPEYDRRFDLNANGCINTADVILYKPIIMTSCTP